MRCSACASSRALSFRRERPILKMSSQLLGRIAANGRQQTCLLTPLPQSRLNRVLGDRRLCLSVAAEAYQALDAQRLLELLSKHQAVFW